jgi:hypothetical protein
MKETPSQNLAHFLNSPASTYFSTILLSVSALAIFLHISQTTHNSYAVLLNDRSTSNNFVRSLTIGLS